MANLRKSSLFTSASSILRLAVGVVTTPLLVRLLGIQEYGLWAVVNSVVAIAALFDFEVSSALKFYLAADNARRDWKSANANTSTAFALMTLLALITTSGLLLATPVLSGLLFPTTGNRGEASRILTVLALGFTLRFWQKFGAATEAALLRYDIQVAVELPVGIAVQLGSVVTALIWPSAFAVAICQTVIVAVACLAHAIAIRRIWPAGTGPVPLFSLTSARQILHFGVADWVTTVGSTVFNNADRVIVNGILGPSAAGLYSAAITVVNKIVELPVSFTRILPPAVSAAWATGDRGRIRHLLSQSIRVNGTVTVLSAAGVLFWAEPITMLMVGAQHQSAVVPALRVMAMIYGLHSMCITAFWFAGGIGRPFLTARWTLLGSLFMAVLIRTMGAQYGLPGAAWGNAGYLVTSIITAEIVRILGYPVSETAKEFLPSVLGLLSCFLFCNSEFYIHLPVTLQLIVFLLVQTALLFTIAGRDSLRQMTDLFFPKLRSRSTVLSIRG